MTYTAPTEPGEDVLDSRDLAARQQEIEDQFELDYEEDQGPGDFAARIRNLGDHDTADEYEALYAFNEEGRSIFGSGDWDESGITLVNDAHFEDYAEQMAADIGAIDPDAGWPLNFIDWRRAAFALQQDYTSMVFDGYEYWGRE